MIMRWMAGRGELARLRRLLHGAEAELDRVRQFDAAILRHLPDPLVVLDAHRRVVRANDAAQCAYGDQLGAVLRHPVLRAAIDRAVPGGMPERADLMLADRDIAATVIALPAGVGPGGGVSVLVLSDHSRDRALDRLRADFVANASHELRTPLTSLIGFIDTLSGPAADDQAAQARFLPIMAEQAARMGRLIDDLLSLSRVEAGEHQTPTTPVDLAGRLPAMVRPLDGIAAERGSRILMTLPPGLPPVLADPDQLQQVMTNLLDNAVKYGRENGTIWLDAAADEDGVRLTVRDDGPGIARAHLPRLTERFYRVDTGRSRAVGGTGLGLAIVKHIVGRHRGRLAIGSIEGEGTTVTLWLPGARC